MYVFHFFTKQEEIKLNGDDAGTEIDSLIEAAKARAQRRELEKAVRQSAEDDTFFKETTTKPARRGGLQAPWHTEFNDTSYANGNKSKLSLKDVTFRQKTTSQADFPEYSIQELKESKLPLKRTEYKDSVPWYPGSNGTNEEQDQQVPYRRSSDVIGESYINKYGNQNPHRPKTFKEKVADVAPVAASSLRSTPYAQHN
ncbi:unnamed protein product [Echinostoma caproni]|uniref:Uncharacterized protein n=1 Tax=Echinostoma caproni TaxID=27848 RepID=A0A3P8I715_9TREM|nr:unnamed protein product [Echinostoma caproni]